MALVASSFRIPLYFRFKGQLSSGVHHKVELDRDNRISLVAYGYSMKDSVEERELALKTAISKHGVAAVVERLEFLSQAWSGTPMFLDVICHDLNFSKSLQWLRLMPRPKFQQILAMIVPRTHNLQKFLMQLSSRRDWTCNIQYSHCMGIAERKICSKVKSNVNLGHNFLHYTAVKLTTVSNVNVAWMTLLRVHIFASHAMRGHLISVVW